MAAKFDGKVRKIVAMRAGYRCSFPDCGRLTIGPGTGANDYSNTGSASHIYGASEQGPRGAGGHSHAERSSIENAIWLCAQHSRVVDANEGEGFPPALLRSFKEEHEARVAAEHAGLPYYWIAGLEVGSAKTGPTILLLDLPVLHLDHNNLSLYVSFFLSQAAAFQVVFTSPEVSLVKSSASLGWSIVKLSGCAPFCKAEALSW